MAALDRMIIDDRDLADRYFGDNELEEFDNDQYLFSKPTNNNEKAFRLNPLLEPNPANALNENTGLFGRRVFLESPSLDNKDEEELYRYVPSRFSEHPSTVAAAATAAPTSETLMDSLDFELDILGAPNARHTMPYQTDTQFLTEPKPTVPTTQFTKPADQSPMINMLRADPRQDPLLGPLLAELDAISTQQRLPPIQQPASVPIHRRNSVPSETNVSRLPPFQSNQGNRAVNDALLDAELYDSLNPRDQQNHTIYPRQPIPYSAPSINSSSQAHAQPQPRHKQQQQPPEQKQLPSRLSNMNTTDIFVPSSYNPGPAGFLSNFGPDDQLFQQPLFNALGRNYVPNARPPQPNQPQQPYDQRDPTFDNSYARLTPPRRAAYPPDEQPPNNYNPYQRQPPLSNRSVPYNANQNNRINDEPFREYQDMYAPPQNQRPLLPARRQPQDRALSPPQHDDYDERHSRSNNPANNQELFFTDHNDDPSEQYSFRQQQPQQQQQLPNINQRNNDQYNEQDSKRQAIWNELQRTNAKVQEKNAKKRESANRREQLLKGNFNSNNSWNGPGNQPNSPPVKPGDNPPKRRPPPAPMSKTNYIEDNIDMIKNKENFYHRYPAKKYENLYSKRKELSGDGKQDDQNIDSNNDFEHTQSSTLINEPTGVNGNSQQRSNLPVTINLNPGDKTQTGNLPASVTIPLDSHVSRIGDKISVNIDLRLVDLQNLKQKQQNERPDWSGLDPLDRHIRKLERSIDQSLPPPNIAPERSAPVSHSTVNPSIGRYGKYTTGVGQGGYSPPSYSSDYYSYSDKVREEDSYLAKMNHVKKGPNFKPYTGRDYEQFKKNNGFGTGFLGFDFDNPNHKEKADKLMKTKEYAQQVDAVNKKKLAEAPRRTLSDTRIPNDASKTQRALEYARVSTRHKPPSGTSTRSTPPDMNGTVPGHRRPTEVAHRPPPAQKPSNRSAQNDNELVERLALRHERDKAQVQSFANPAQRRRELFDDNNNRASDIEKLAQDRANQRHVSPPRQLPPSGASTNGNARRPLRFDKPLISDETTNHPSQPYRPVQQHSENSPRSHHTAQEHYPVQPQYSSEEYYPAQPHHSTQPQRPAQQPRSTQDRHSTQHVNDLANRHNDEKMLMEAIRQELTDRPLADDEELIVVEQ